MGKLPKQTLLLLLSDGHSAISVGLSVGLDFDVPKFWFGLMDAPSEVMNTLLPFGVWDLGIS